MPPLSALPLFAVTALVLLVIPGPSVLYITTRSATQGRRAGLVSVLGVHTGTIVHVVAAVAGLSALLVASATAFSVVKVAGALYLVFLGARQLWQFWQRRSNPAQPLPVSSRSGAYMQGLLVSLSNPKVLLFLGAFLPQFVDPASDPVRQLWVLAVLFVVVLAAVDVGYTVAIGKARTTFNAAKLAVLDGAAGVLLLAGGVALAMVRRP